MLRLRSPPRAALFVVLVVALSIAHVHAQGDDELSGEQIDNDALRRVFAHFGLPSSLSKKHWSRGMPCADKWGGVVCDSDFRVREVYLADVLDQQSGNSEADLGTIWRILMELDQLVVLELTNIPGLTGELPTVDEPPALEKLHISNTGMTEWSAVFDFIWLEELVIENNEHLMSPRVPDSFHRLRYLRRLGLARCGFAGDLPASILLNAQLEFLAVDGNAFDTIPVDFNWPHMEELHLGENPFHKPIPSRGFLDSLPALRRLDISSCRLRGVLPSVATNTKLESLRLEDNELRGSLQNLGLTRSHAIKEIVLTRNQLTGSIPESMLNLPFLTTLMLSTNILSGTLPDLLRPDGYPVALRTLHLSNNVMHGELPWPGDVIDLDLSQNRFTGLISAAYTSSQFSRLRLGPGRGFYCPWPEGFDAHSAGIVVPCLPCFLTRAPNATRAIEICDHHGTWVAPRCNCRCDAGWESRLCTFRSVPRVPSPSPTPTPEPTSPMARVLTVSLTVTGVVLVVGLFAFIRLRQAGPRYTRVRKDKTARRRPRTRVPPPQHEDNAPGEEEPRAPGHEHTHTHTHTSHSHTHAHSHGPAHRGHTH